MINFWVSVLALSILLYVLLDGFDLGIGILYGFAREDRTRRAWSRRAPIRTASRPRDRRHQEVHKAEC